MYQNINEKDNGINNLLTKIYTIKSKYLMIHKNIKI